MKHFISLFFLLLTGLVLIAGNAQAKTSQEKITTPPPTVEKTALKAKEAQTAGKQKTQTAAQKVNINTADANTLQNLPGIGPKIAKRIIEHRQKQAFTSPQDLLQVKGIGEKVLQPLLPLISVR